MRTRMYGGVGGRKTKVGGKPTFVFLLLDLKRYYNVTMNARRMKKSEIPMEFRTSGY